MALATTRDDHLVAKPVQRLGESAPDTRTAARDEDCIASEFHLFSFVLVGCNCFRLHIGPLALAGQFAAIDSDGRTRDEGGLVGSEKNNGLGNLFGRPARLSGTRETNPALLSSLRVNRF